MYEVSDFLNARYLKFLIPLCTFLFITFTGVFGQQDGPIRIVPIGDSITMTYDTSWRFELWKLLRTDGFDITYAGSLTDWFDPGDGFPKQHEGHGGWTINQIIDEFDSLVSYDFEVALVHLGTNDIWGGDEPAVALAELGQLIDKIRKKNPAAIIILARIIPTDIGIDNFAEFSERIPEIAALKTTPESPVYIADLFSNFDKTTGLGEDGVHPSTEGFVMMGRDWYKTAAPILADIKAPDPIQYPYPPEKKPDLVLDPSIPKINNTDFVLSSGWNFAEGEGKYNGDDHYTGSPGEYYEVTFTGNSVAVYGATAAHHGTGKIYIDNMLVEENVSWISEDRVNLALLYSKELSNGPHTLKVVANGDGVITADVVEYTEGEEPGLLAWFTHKQIDFARKMVRFDASVSTGNPAGYEWDFGDGQTGSGALVDHLYEGAGTYEATLTALDAQDNSDRVTITITVLGDAGGAGQIAADHSFLHYTGRVDFTDPKGPVLIWPGTSILTRFDGTGLKVKFEGNGANFFQILVDGKETILEVESGYKIYDVTADLEDTIHTLEIVKRTEGTVGTAAFYGLALDDGKAILPTFKKKRNRIEFFGDSITVGASNEDPVGNEQWGDFSTYNNYLAYGALTARALNLEYMCTAVSGIGLLKSWSVEDRTQEQIWDKLYPANDSPVWENGTRQPEIVVVNVGQNDWSLGVTGEFGPAYKNYLANIRSKYPGSYIICTLGPLGVNENEEYKGYVTRAVEDLNEAGDDKILIYIFKERTYEHPRLDAHRAMADELTGFITATIELKDPASEPPKPVNPDATPEAVRLLEYIYSIYGTKILSGQQESYWVDGPDYEMNYIKEHTGKLPAIRGLDLIEYNGVAERAIEWWELGGIPSICWHWGAPTKGDGYEASKETIDVVEALTPGTELHIDMMRGLDRAAAELKILQDAGVPVLWRPLHELDGGWFWWSKSGSEPFKQLWRLMYDYFTYEKGLNNLIWVFGYTTDAKAEWYPGDEYLDIAGADHYGEGAKKDMYDDVVAIVGEKIPVCYHENGPIPDPDALISEEARWAWFLTWHTIHIEEQNTPEHLDKVYNHDYVLTLDELPDLKVTIPPPPVKVEISWNGTSWNSGFAGNIILTNKSDKPVEGWKVEVRFKNGEQMTNSWCSVSSQEGDLVTFRNLDWNRTIAPGQSIIFGFQGLHNGTFEFPGDAEVIPD